MLTKIHTVLFCFVFILFPVAAHADDKAEKLLASVAVALKETESLSGDYEIIRRHLDPYEEIRERGQFSLMRPNYLSVRGASFLPSKTAGQWRKVAEATGYISNGSIFYTIFPGKETVSYKDVKANADGGNIAVNLSPIADFFNRNNSFVNQIAAARSRKILTSLRYAGEKEWENAKYKVLEFVTDEIKRGVSQHTVTQLYIGNDKIIRRLISTEKFGDLTSETETILRNVRSKTKLRPADFSYALPPGAKAYVPPPAPLAGGTQAPDPAFVDGSGKPVKLSDFRGKTVILDFWATWCLPCIKSFPHTARIAKSFPGKEIVVLAVNIWDNKINATDWVAKNPQFGSFVFVTDTEGAGDKSSIALFQVPNLPLQYVISPNGKIVASFQGYLGASDELETAIKNADDF